MFVCQRVGDHHLRRVQWGPECTMDEWAALLWLSFWNFRGRGLLPHTSILRGCLARVGPKREHSERSERVRLGTGLSVDAGLSRGHEPRSFCDSLGHLRNGLPTACVECTSGYPLRRVRHLRGSRAKGRLTTCVPGGWERGWAQPTLAHRPLSPRGLGLGPGPLRRRTGAQALLALTGVGQCLGNLLRNQVLVDGQLSTRIGRKQCRHRESKTHPGAIHIRLNFKHVR